MGIAIAIALVATFPMVLSPFSRLIGHGDVDVGNHAWGPWWWWSTLGRGTLPWETKLLGAPAGGVLWFIDPVLAGLGAAVVGIVGVVGAYNLVILLYVALAALATRSLARAFGAGEAAWVAAVTAAMGPYLLSEVHNGVSEAVGVAWGTFALAAARRGLAGGGARAWVACGAWLGLATAGTWYYGFAAGITIGCWALLELLGPDRRAALRNVAGALGAGALAGVLAAPVLALVRASVSDPASLVLRSDVGPAVREVLLAHNAVDPRAFFAPFGFQSVDLAAQGEAFLHSSYVGLVALALAGWALRRGRVSWRVAIGVLPAAVLSLGAWLSWGGEWVTIGGGRLALPFGWLVSALPDAGATHSQRLAWPVIATVAALAAVGAGELIREHGRRVLIWITAACALDMALSAPWPLARMDALDTRAHEALGELARAERAAARAEGRPVRVGVLDLPAEVGRTMATSRYLVYQAASGLPIPYRPDARGGTATLFGRPWFNVLFAMSAARPDEVESLRRALDGVTRVDLNLDSTELRWIVLHRELERGAGDVLRLEQQLRAWFGEPEVSGEHLTWDVRARGAGAGQGEVLR
jgi:hypothetical protein